MKTQIAFGMDEALQGKTYSMVVYPKKVGITFETMKPPLGGGVPRISVLNDAAKALVKDVNDTVDELDGLDGTSIRFKRATVGDVMVETQRGKLAMLVELDIVFVPSVPDQKLLKDVLFNKGWQS